MTDGSFWRLKHDDLAAVLARRDIKGEALRVYLALADLTRGYGKDRDIVSLSQIAERAGGLSRPHVLRGLTVLAAKGLYGQAQGIGQDVVRWAAWPPPPVPDAGNAAVAVPVRGNTTVPDAGNETVPGAVPRAGTHQDTKKHKKSKKGVPPSGGRRSSTEADSNADTGGACGRLVALWVSSYRQNLGRDYLPSGKGQLAGTLKAMLKGMPEADLALYIGRWFAAQRKDYGIALFKGKVEGGDAELVGRGDAHGDYNDPISLRNGRLLAQEAGE